MILQNKINWAKSNLILLFLLCFSVSANESLLQELTTISQEAPTELTWLTQHLAKHLHSDEQATKVIGYCNLINKDLKNTKMKHVFFMLKSEIYRGLLRNQYLKKENKLQVTSSLMSSIFQKIQKNDIVYSEFSQWIMKAIYSDLEPYLKDKFIDSYQSVDRNDFKLMEKVKKLEKILSYTSSWLEKMEKLSPESFNELVTQMAIDILWSISSKTYYFSNFSNKYKQIADTYIFKIPTTKKVATPIISNQQSEVESAKELIKGISADDLSSASSEIDQLNTDIEKNTWQPK